MWQMIAVPSGPGADFEVPVELIIGTVPLRKADQSMAPSLQQLQAARAAMHGRHSPKAARGNER